jgi:peptide chain release factor 2
MEDPAIWNDPKRALELGKEKKSLEQVVDVLGGAITALADSTELYDMAKEEADLDTVAAIGEDTAKIAEHIESMEFRRMFNNPMDSANCFLDIQAGAGGTEACDWASILLRQYLRYAEKKGFKAEQMEETQGDVAGIKSTTLKIEGDYAFGFLRTETGLTLAAGATPALPACLCTPKLTTAL